MAKIQALSMTAETARIGTPSEEEPIRLDGRRLVIPDELKYIGVTLDNRAEQVIFDFPDSYDGVSWHDKNVFIDYINAGGESASYVCEPDFENGSMSFSWDIMSGFTRREGAARFAVRITGADSYRWGSEIASVQIVQGIEHTGEYIEEVPTEFEKWQNRLAVLIEQAREVTSNVEAIQKNLSTDRAELTAGLQDLNSAIDDAEKATDRAIEAWNNAQKEPISEDNYLNGIRYLGSSFHGLCSRSGLEIMHIQGKTNQTRTSGYNLYDSFRAIKSDSEYDMFTDEDGRIVVSGAGSTGGQSITFSHEEVLNLLHEGNLNFSSFPAMNPYALIQLKNSDGSTEVNVLSTHHYLAVTHDFLNDDSSTYVNKTFKNPNVDVSYGTFAVMAWQDGTGEYEPYTGGKPAPNPDYPMPFNAFEIQNYICMGSNIFELADKNIGSSYRTNCKGGQLATGEIYIKATGANAWIYNVAEARLKAGTTNGKLFRVPPGESRCYIKSLNGVMNAIYITQYDERKMSMGYISCGANKAIDLYDNTAYVSVRVGKSDTVANGVYTDKVVLSFSPIAEWHEPHYEELSLPQPLTLYSLPDGTADEYAGDGRIIRRIEKVTVNSGDFLLDNSHSYSLDVAAFSTGNIYPTDFLQNGNEEAANIYCTAFQSVPMADSVNAKFPVQGIAASKNSDGLWIVTDKFKTAEELNRYINTEGMEILMPLEFPKIEYYEMPVLPSWDDDCRIFFEAKTETEIEWRPIPIA